MSHGQLSGCQTSRGQMSWTHIKNSIHITVQLASMQKQSQTKK